MKTFYYLIAMVLLSTVAYSQNIRTSNLEWNSVATFDAENGFMQNEISRIVSTPTQVIWYDSHDVVKRSLTITDSQGSWSNVSHNGSIELNVSDNDDVGVVEFVRASGTIKIIIHFVLKDGKSIYELTITNVNSL